MVFSPPSVVSCLLQLTTDREPDSAIGGSYGAIAQLTFTPSDRLGIGLAYVRSYNRLDTGTGSDRPYLS